MRDAEKVARRQEKSTPIPPASEPVREEAFISAHSAPPSSPLLCGPRLSVSEFVAKYALLPEAAEYLKTMQFMPGSSTHKDDIQDEDWKEAGFKAPLWREVKKANKLYCIEIGREVAQ